MAAHLGQGKGIVLFQKTGVALVDFVHVDFDGSARVAVQGDVATNLF